MERMEMFSGNACFLVKNTSDEMSRKEFEDYLEGEGFAQFRKYLWKDRGCFYINVNSLHYSAGVPKPVKLTGTIVDESIKNPFTIDEFKTIWNIIKRHIMDFNPTDEIRKGCSTFLVCEESLNDPKNEFIDYLCEQNFTRLDNDSYGGRGFVCVNVKSMLFSSGRMANVLVSTFVGENSTCGLSVDEFKRVWEILKKHKSEL